MVVDSFGKGIKGKTKQNKCYILTKFEVFSLKYHFSIPALTFEMNFN